MRDYQTEELAAKLADPAERFFLVDVLAPESWLRGHLPGAISLPLERLEDDAERVLPDKEIEIVTYCAAPA